MDDLRFWLPLGRWWWSVGRFGGAVSSCSGHSTHTIVTTITRNSQPWNKPKMASVSQLLVWKSIRLINMYANNPLVRISIQLLYNCSHPMWKWYIERYISWHHVHHTDNTLIIITITINSSVNQTSKHDTHKSHSTLAVKSHVS